MLNNNRRFMPGHARNIVSLADYKPQEGDHFYFEAEGVPTVTFIHGAQDADWVASRLDACLRIDREGVTIYERGSDE